MKHPLSSFVMSAESITHTSTPRTQFESTLSVWIAEWIAENCATSWEVSAEEVGAVEGENLRIDLIVRQKPRMPAAVEFEFGSPAVDDAKRLIGHRLKGGAGPFTEVLAVGYDEETKNDDRRRFRRRLRSNEPFMRVQIVSQRNGGNGGITVWPDKPLPANAEDLMAFIEYLQAPQEVIITQGQRTASAIKAAGTRLHEAILMSSALCDETLEALRQLTGAQHRSNGVPNGNGKVRCPKKCGHDAQAVETVCAIWLVAIDLQNDLASHSVQMRGKGLSSTFAVKQDAVSLRLTASELLTQWRLIADVNYLPVVELGIAALSTCEPFSAAVSEVLEKLHHLCEHINAAQTKHVFNFAGELWQRLVPDREERAAHYTKPHVAELLATLAAERFNDLDAGSVGKLNILDAACGTGTLIGAGERAIRRKYWKAGGRDERLHRKRMENHIFAMDVNGIAGTLTAKRLTDMDFERDYTRSQIAVITHPAGSLMLLNPGTTGVSQVLGFKGVTPTTGPGGDPGVFHVADGSIDLALMNPPYSRPRKGRRQETTNLAPLRRAARRRGFNMSHGNAGLATDFGDLSNIRLRPGGVFAHVLPLTAARAPSWNRWRAQLERDFRDIVVITATESMSADTNISEMLVIATKERGARRLRRRQRELLCVNLDRQFTTLPQGYAIAKELMRIPKGSNQGVLSFGTYARLRLTRPGNPWRAVGSGDNEVTSVVDGLVDGDAWDPDTNAKRGWDLQMSTLADVATSGPTHHLIGHLKGAEAIGAFEWTPLADMVNAPAQQSLWTADAKSQTSILTRPTHGGVIVDEELANRMIQQRSRWFIKRGMRWTSQATTVAFSARAAHGGSAWNALLGGTDESMRAVAIFYNSVFGGLLRNAYGSIQQLGRAQLQVTAIGGLYCPAFNADTSEAERARLIAAVKFEELSRLELMPFASCIIDENRHKIDSVAADMLGLDPEDSEVQAMLDRYRYLFARQPNVNGGQKRHLDALRRYEAERGLAG